MLIQIKENSFDAAPGGNAGAISYQAPIGSHSSPSNYQDPSKFHSSDYNKYYDKDKSGSPDVSVTGTSGSLDKDIETLFKRKQKPTVDDVLCGIQYELQSMIHKDKGVAKERVINNMRKYGPKYYTGLNMLNVDDKKMDVSETMKERINVINRSIFERDKKREPMKINSQIQDIIKEKQESMFRRNLELCKRIQ